MAGGCCGGAKNGYKRIWRHVAAGKEVRTTEDQQLAQKWQQDDGGRLERRVVKADTPTTH